MKKFLKNYHQNLKSDLASEFIASKKRKQDKVVSISEIVLDSVDAEKIGKREGRYVTIETKSILNCEVENFGRVSRSIKEELQKFIQGKNILVVGLGNYKLGADALGVKVCNKINVTRNIISSNFIVSAIIPGVLGRTGVESFEIVKGVCESVKPSTIIVIDSLCAGSVSRLLTTFQISDTGIIPGSGVSNHRQPIDSASLNAKVVSIGIPTVVYASTIVKEYEGKPFTDNLVVSPKDIDFYVNDCASVISSALNSIFFD